MNTVTVPDKYRDDLKRLRMFDDDFFRKLCHLRTFVDVLAGYLFNDIHVIEHYSQYDMNYSPKKSIIPDLHLTTDRGNINIEVERHRERLESRRVRYNASVLDVHSSSKGMEYKDMMDTKTVFICEFDPIGEGLPVYSISSIITDTMNEYDDGREYILINGSYEGNDRIGRLIHDLRQSEAKDMVIPELREIMKYYKESEEGVKEMCEIFEGIAKRNKAEGIQESNVSAIRKCINKLNYTIMQALEFLDIPAEEHGMYKELLKDNL